jgi:GTP-binding protein Era
MAKRTGTRKTADKGPEKRPSAKKGRAAKAAGVVRKRTRKGQGPGAAAAPRPEPEAAATAKAATATAAVPGMGPEAAAASRPAETTAAGPAPSPAVRKYRTGYVALVGRPNTGKSTLLNSMLGRKVSIVSDKPQTTRISILGVKTTERGQIIFVDNPGIHKPLHALNRRMMNFVHSALETSDLICLLIDASQSFGHGDEFVIETLKKVRTPVFLLINKVDIVRKDKVLPIIDRYKDLLPFREIVPVSALKGDNLDALERLIYDCLPESESLWSESDISRQSERFLFAELIREKILKYVSEELPFATAVYVESIERKEEADRKHPGRTRPVTVVKASIFVEKDNHRKIIIGRQGNLIKTIGIEARREIEQSVGHKVFLDLHVRVRERWRDAEDVLDLIEGQ